MIRVADYIAKFLADAGLKHVFLITGGGAMHLNDAFGREKRLSYLCNHHEQASAIAAESYCRYSGRMAAVNVTTGPGGVNALTGVYGAFVDSLAMFVVSGQVKRATIAGEFDLPLRQLGDQEVNIIDMARPVTKYAVLIRRPEDIRYEMEKAYHLATTGRPGPVWIDVPIDVQSSKIDPDSLRGFDPLAEGRDGQPLAIEAETGTLTGSALSAACAEIVAKLRAAKRPVIMAGTGLRIAGAVEQFHRLCQRLGVPVVTGWNAHDLIGDDNPLNAGRPGTVGDRPGNFAVQKADFVLVLGCRLNIRQISYNYESFAQNAFKVMVDIDKAELSKPTLKIDMPVHAELGAVLAELEALTAGHSRPQAHADYLAWCQDIRRRYPAVLPGYEAGAAINPYVFSRQLFRQMGDSDVVVTGNGAACVITFQAAEIRQGQRLYTNSGCASMGYDLPAAIGAAVAGAERVVCLAGDGSIMMNLQELQTIAAHRMNIKIFVLNNAGYHSIRQTQKAYFSDNPVGRDAESGVALPDFAKVAAAFGIPSSRCESKEELEASIAATLSGEGPALCEVLVDPEQAFEPKLASRVLPDGSMASPSLEDMFPFLPREEMAAIMETETE